MILFWNRGICYDRVIYSEKSEAEEHSKRCTAENDYVNGGYFHGMSCGGIREERREDGSTGWEVTSNYTGPLDELAKEYLSKNPR